jgi:glutamate--cysteine ligase
MITERWAAGQPDYADETDCIDKLRLSIALPHSRPLRRFAVRAATGFLTTRGEIWARTDPDRTGLLPQLFQPEAGFATYVEYALDVPMYFIFRDGRFLDMTGERFPFRRYLATGFADHRATLADWDLHLSTLFPEARLRPQIEVRPADSLPPHLTLAVGALLKGILYDSAAREETWSLFRHQRSEERAELCRQSWRLGLKTPVGSRSLREIALEVWPAPGGLRRQGNRTSAGLTKRLSGGSGRLPKAASRWPSGCWRAGAVPGGKSRDIAGPLRLPAADLTCCKGKLSVPLRPLQQVESMPKASWYRAT